MEQKRYVPYVKPLPEKARKVRGGLKLVSKDWPLQLAWAGARWMGLIESSATQEVIREGAEYARLGQVRSLTIDGGKITAEVQGRQFRPHRPTLEFTKFTEAQWHAVETAMTDQAFFAARLLAHEVPDTIETIFDPLGLHLFPHAGTAQDVKASCTCGHADLPGKWCKHLVCMTLLVTERMESNPFLIFTLRGLPGEELIERLRQRRAAASGGDMFTQSLAQRLGAQFDGGAASRVESDTAGGGESGESSQARTGALEAHLDDFWEMGPGLDQLETPVRAPDVSHALLRRLGPSPFKEGKFPLVGLLATCYDTISKAAISGIPRGPAPASEPGTPNE